MPLSKIKLANKRSKRQAKRKLRQAEASKDRATLKIRNRRMRTMMIQGRREHLAKRRQELDYVDKLESEIS